MAETIIGLSQSNAQMRTTIRYLDQIQRSTDRLGRTRYQSLIKTNNELRATGRRLESIYSTAVRLSRLRIAPQVEFADRATPALDGLLNKLKSIRSGLLDASANVNYKVSHQISGVSVDVNSQPLIDALQVNTQSLNNLTNKLDSINIGAAGAEEKPKTFLQKMKGMFDRGKSLSSGVTKAFDARSSGKKLWKEIKRPSTPGNRWKKVFKVTKRGAKFVNDFSTAGSDLIGGIDGLWGDVKGLFGGGGTEGSGASGIISKIGGGVVKKAGKFLGPLNTMMSVADFATAPPEQRGRAGGSMIGGAAGTAIGSAIGTALLPGIGTWVGGAVGGWAGSEVGGWIGDKAKDIGNALSGAGNFVAEKAKNIFGGITDFFGGSKIEEPPVAPAQPAPAAQPMPAPAYIPSALSITGPNAYLSGMGGGPTAAALAGPNLMQMQAMGMGTGAGAQAQAAGNGTPSTMTVQISEEQMSSLAGYLTDFKTEVTNQVSVNVPAGAVQVTVRENAIDYDALALQIGGRLSNELRRAMENRRSTVMA